MVEQASPQDLSPIIPVSESQTDEVLVAQIPQFEAPRSKNGRVRWLELRENPDRLIAYIEGEVRRFIEDNPFLTTNSLAGKRMFGLINAIGKYYPGGISALRERVDIAGKWHFQSAGVNEDDLPVDDRGRVLWINLSDDRDRIKDVLESQARKLPTGSRLRTRDFHDMDMSGVAAAINLYYPGGFYALRENLGVTNKQRTRRFWKRDDAAEKIRKMAAEFYQREGGLSQGLLTAGGRNDLAVAISRHYPGRLTQLKEDLGIEQTRRPSHFWDPEKTEKATSEFYQIIGQLNYYVLREHNRLDISNAIQKYPGGLPALREKLGIIEPTSPPISFEEANKQLEKLLEEAK